MSEAAQLAGDGLLQAVEQRVAAITLANELDAVCGDTTAPDLTPVPVQLDELSMHLESGDDLGDRDEFDRWLEVTPIGSREAWDDMREFAGTIGGRRAR